MMEPEKPELFGYYFQIPIKAEVKKVQISMLSSSVQEKIRQLGGRTIASYVVVVSPITIQKLPKSDKSRTTAAEHSPVIMSDTSQSFNGRSMGKADKETKKDLGTYLVHVKCSKDIALTILQLAKTSKEEKSSSESESSNFSNSLVLNHNLQMIEMKAATLYIYKNIMYLLPKSQEANTADEENEADKSEATESKARARLRGNRKYKHNSLGCVTLRNFSFLQQQDGRIVGSVTEKSVTIVRSGNKERCDLPDEMKSTAAGPSSGSSTVKSLQMSFWEQSERQIKRKLPYLSNEEPFIKKTHQSDSDAKQDSIVAKNVLVRSPFQPHSSSSDAPLFSSEKTSPCEYIIDSKAKQDSTVAKNVLAHYPLQTHSSSSDAPSPLSPQESPASFSHEETSPCEYLIDSDVKQDSTVAKNVLAHYPLQTHSSSSDAPSPLSPQESSASFSHEETSPCGYVSDSGAKQDSTVAKNVLGHSAFHTHPSSSNDPSPLSPQESSASCSHEETSPCGYVSDSGAKQDSTVAKNVLDRSLLRIDTSSSDASSPLSPQESPASFSHEETSPCGYVGDSGAKQDSIVAKNVHVRSPFQPHSSSSDALSFSSEETSPCEYLIDSNAKQDSTVAKNALAHYPLQTHSSSSDAPSPLSPQESPASFSHKETSPCGYVSDSGAKQDSAAAKNVLANSAFHTHPSFSNDPSPLSPQESSASCSHEETSPCGYVSDSGAKQDSTVAKNVLDRSLLRIDTSSSDASSPLSPQESPASFSHEETSPCGYVGDSGAKQDSTVAKNVHGHSAFHTHPSSSDAPSPLSPQESPASFSHEETSPYGYVSDSGAKQDSTAAKNVLDHSAFHTHPSSSNDPSPLSPQESSASCSHEETSPCGYVSDSGAKQDSTVANNVLDRSLLRIDTSSSDASSPLSPQESPASFSHEETSPCGYVGDSGAKQDSTVAKNVHGHSAFHTHPSSSDAPSPLSPQESPASFSHEETSPYGYMSYWEQSERQIKRKLPYLSNEEPFIKKPHQSDSGAKQDSIVAKNVLVRSPFQPHSSSSDALSFSSEKTSPCEYLIDSDAKQDSTVAKNVLAHYPLQTHSSSSDAPSPLSPQESPASFSHEETSPCGYVSDSGAKQDSTVAKNVLDRSLLQIHLSSSDASSPLSPQESSASFSHEETSPCGYVGDSGAKQDSTVAKNVHSHSAFHTHPSSSDAPSPLSPQESPASFSHEETSPYGYMSYWEQSERQIKRKLPYLSNEEPFIKKPHQSDSGAKQDSIVAKNVLVRSPFQPHSSSSDALSFSSEETSPCEYLIDSDAKQDSTVAKNALAHYPLQTHSSSSDAPSPLSPQESPASFSHKETSPCGYVSDSGAKQDSAAAKNVLANSAFHTHPSFSNDPSPLSPQESSASCSHEETSPCGYVSDSGAKQDSTVAKNVLDRSLLQIHLLSSDASSPLSPQESPASFSHEETSPCGYVGDSGAKQDSTVAKNVLGHSAFHTHPSSSDAPSPLSPQESPASFSHEETSPYGYVSDSGAKQDSTVAKNVLGHSAFHTHPSSSDAPSPLSPQESPASFSHEETSPCGYVSDSGAKQDSTVAKNVLGHSAFHTHPSSTDAPSPLSLSSSEFTIGSQKSNDPEETSPASEPSLMSNHLRSEQAFSFLDIDDTTRDEKRQRLLDRVIEFKKKVEEMQQKSN